MLLRLVNNPNAAPSRVQSLRGSVRSSVNRQVSGSSDVLVVEKVTKFDVVTIAFTILAAIGGMTTAVFTLIKWVAG